MLDTRALIDGQIQYLAGLLAEKYPATGTWWPNPTHRRRQYAQYKMRVQDLELQEKDVASKLVLPPLVAAQDRPVQVPAPLSPAPEEAASLRQR